MDPSQTTDTLIRIDGRTEALMALLKPTSGTSVADQILEHLRIQAEAIVRLSMAVERLASLVAQTQRPDRT